LGALTSVREGFAKKRDRIAAPISLVLLLGELLDVTMYH
jgi:hypothetical protein